MELRTFTHSVKKHLGQGMTEYIIIVALVAVAAIGSFKLFGETARHQIAGLATELSGQNADTSIQSSQESAENAASEAERRRDMGTYGGVNDVGN